MKIEILKFDHFGRGIARNKGKVLFIDRTLPGEIVDVNIINEKRTHAEGKIKKIIEESSYRIDPVCPFYKKCGGCNFLHTTYQKEKEIKKQKAREVLGRCDNFYDIKKMNYRNKVTLHVDGKKIGLYEEKTKKIVNINYCYLLGERINKVLADLQKVDFSNYNIKKVSIKENSRKTLLYLDGDVDNKFLTLFSYVDTIISKNQVLKGNGYLEEKIDDKIFKITANAFFQVNRDGLNFINSIIKNFLKGKNIQNALDLYSGTSLWSILISDNVKKVTSIEVNKEASLNALDNIKRNGVSNVKVINGKVEDYLDSFRKVDLIIVDPPRSGLDKKTRENLRRINAKYLIYISCDMLTLKRDLENINDIYNICEIDLVDMFKRTYHCEVVTILERK